MHSVQHDIRNYNPPNSNPDRWEQEAERSDQWTTVYDEAGAASCWTANNTTSGWLQLFWQRLATMADDAYVINGWNSQRLIYNCVAEFSTWPCEPEIALDRQHYSTIFRCNSLNDFDGRTTEVLAEDIEVSETRISVVANVRPCWRDMLKKSEELQVKLQSWHSAVVSNDANSQTAMHWLKNWAVNFEMNVWWYVAVKEYFTLQPVKIQSVLRWCNASVMRK